MSNIEVSVQISGSGCKGQERARNHWWSNAVVSIEGKFASPSRKTDVNKCINEKIVGAVTGRLAGESKAGTIRTYINPDDHKTNLETVKEIPRDLYQPLPDQHKAN